MAATKSKNTTFAPELHFCAKKFTLNGKKFGYRGVAREGENA